MNYMLRITFTSVVLLGCLYASAKAEEVGVLNLSSRVPDAWVAERPQSEMRKLQYRVPTDDGIEPGAFIVYYFGPNQGGSLEANVARWRSQFTRPDGSPVEPKVTEIKEARLPVTLVELRGSYARGVGIGPTGEARPDRMLLAGVVQTPKGNLYPQLHGPVELVAAQRQAFVDFITNLRPQETN